MFVTVSLIQTSCGLSVVDDALSRSSVLEKFCDLLLDAGDEFDDSAAASFPDNGGESTA
jgi:hypothetical protein